MRLARHLSAATSMKPGQWTDETASGRPAICCTGCGGIFELEETHTVRGAGIVTPIVSCPYVCPLMEFITLDDWQEEVLR